MFNPSKSVSLWPHTCASSYRGLCRSNSLSAGVALSAEPSGSVCLHFLFHSRFVQTFVDPSCVPRLYEWSGWIYEGITQRGWGVLDDRQSTCFFIKSLPLCCALLREVCGDGDVHVQRFNVRNFLAFVVFCLPRRRSPTNPAFVLFCTSSERARRSATLPHLAPF